MCSLNTLFLQTFHDLQKHLIKNKNVRREQKSQIRFHENIGPIVALQYSWLDLPLFLPLAVIKVMKASNSISDRHV